MGAVVAINQLCSHSKLLTRGLNAALEYEADLEFGRHLSDIDCPVAIHGC